MDGRENRSGLSRVDGEDLGAYVRRLDEYIQRLDWQSEGHRQWYTHKNPYGCWICETLQVCRLLENELVDLERVLDRQDDKPDSEPGPTEPNELDDK